MTSICISNDNGIDTLATDEHRRGCLEVQTVFPTTGSRYGWRDAFADICVYQGHVETLDGINRLIVHEVGHTAVVLAVVVHAEQGVVSAEPVVVVLVNALATDLQLNILQQLLGGVEGGAGTHGVLGKHELDHDVSDQITVTGDLGGHLVAKSNGAVRYSWMAYTLPFGIFEGTRLYLMHSLAVYTVIEYPQTFSR
jgi:hypothetical protein